MDKIIKDHKTELQSGRLKSDMLYHDFQAIKNKYEKEMTETNEVNAFLQYQILEAEREGLTSFDAKTYKKE